MSGLAVVDLLRRTIGAPWDGGLRGSRRGAPTDARRAPLRRRPGGPVLHRRHNRFSQRRNALPSQHRDFGAGYARDQARRATEGAVLLHAAPMFHVAGLCGWIAQVLIGGVHVMVPAFKPDAVFAAIRDHQVTDVVLVPTMIQMLIDDPAMGEYDMSSLRNILYGGSPISEALLTRAMRLLPGVRFTQVYGMTEAAPVVSLLWHQDHHGSLLNSAGRAAPHSEIRVIDESGGAAPTGAVGEICVRGDHVTRRLLESTG